MLGESLHCYYFSLFFGRFLTLRWVENNILLIYMVICVMNLGIDFKHHFPRISSGIRFTRIIGERGEVFEDDVGEGAGEG